MRFVWTTIYAVTFVTCVAMPVYAGGGSSLVAGRFFGGSGMDNIVDLARTSSGDIVVCGNITESFDVGDTRGAYTIGLGGEDGFLAILSSDLRTVKAFTYVGGSGKDSVVACVVRHDGRIAICGVTESVDITTTQPCIDPTYSSHRDGFLQIFSNDLRELSYGTYINGNGDDVPLDMQVDEAGATYICGRTTSIRDLPFTNSIRHESGGSQDAFILKLSESAAQVTYGTYLGGAADDAAVSIAVREDGALLVTGWTESTDFPLAPKVTPPNPWSPGGDNPYDGTFNGGRRDAFFAMVGADGSRLVFSTFFGGNEDDEGRTVGFDAQNNPFLFGTTKSTDLPVTAGRQQNIAGGIDGFIASFSTEGKTLLTSSFFGGNGDDIVQSCAWAIGSQFYVIGSTTSRDWLSSGAGTSTTISGLRDMFLIRVSASQLGYVTLIGGAGLEDDVRMILDENGDVFATCRSTSPRLAVGIDTVYNAGSSNSSDGLIIKWAFGTTTLLSPTATSQICEGQNVNFTWTTAELSPHVHFSLEYSDDRLSWNSIADSLTSRSHAWTPLNLDPGTSYWFRLMSSRGHVYATSRALRVGQQTMITRVSEPKTACVGETIEVNATASGDDITYQWKRNGTAIPGAAGSSYTITQASDTATGSYVVEVSGRCGQVTSDPIHVRVVSATEIVRQPQDVVLKLGDRLELTCEANVDDVTVQWFHNEVLLSTATSATYVVESVSKADEGIYRCLVTGSCGTASTRDVTVSIDATTSAVDDQNNASFRVSIMNGVIHVEHAPGRIDRIDCVDVTGRQLRADDLRVFRGPAFVIVTLADGRQHRRTVVLP
ncbi:MAG TPA: immunoglobulin domain-containing protein [Chlorobiota bacterium]|nr:immunoglobulin domain-containing protein [Chlorobiota bacterium]